MAENNDADETNVGAQEESTEDVTEETTEPTADETSDVQAEADVSSEASDAPNEGEEAAAEDEAGEAAGEEEAAAPEKARDADGFSAALPTLEEGSERVHVPGGVGYEIIYVVQAGDSATIDQSSQRVRDMVESLEGAVDNIRASEVRRFAFPIQKQTEGVYIVVNARFKPDQTGEMDRFFKLEENVLRHMMLREDV